MKIKYSKAALKFLSKLEKKSVSRITSAIQGLTLTPPEGDIKPLRGCSNGEMRLRVGGWRVIYCYAEEQTVTILLVLDIGNRGDIYK